VTSNSGVTPTGSVTFHVNNGTSNTDYPTALVNGVATLQQLGVGSYTITADFIANANFNASVGTPPISQVITPASTTTVVASTNTNAVYGEATITATVSSAFSTPTGNVTFLVNGSPVVRPLVNGVATLTPPLNASATPYTITANYAGDANFSGSSGNTIIQTVSAASTDTAVASSANPSVFGQSVTFTATVSAHS